MNVFLVNPIIVCSLQMHYSSKFLIFKLYCIEALMEYMLNVQMYYSSWSNKKGLLKHSELKLVSSMFLNKLLLLPLSVNSYKDFMILFSWVN